MSNFTVLIIDDNDDTNKLVKLVLQQDTDWQIEIASRGRDGITQARSRPPEIILLDIAMPEMDGIEVYRALKSSSNTRSIPIIFLTAMPMLEQTLIRKIGKNVAIITKPLNILTLSERIIDVWLESQKPRFVVLSD